MNLKVGPIGIGSTPFSGVLFKNKCKLIFGPFIYSFVGIGLLRVRIWWSTSSPISCITFFITVFFIFMNWRLTFFITIEKSRERSINSVIHLCSSSRLALTIYQSKTFCGDILRKFYVWGSAITLKGFRYKFKSFRNKI